MIENPQFIAENVEVIGLMALAACAWLALTVCAPLLPVPFAGMAYLAGSLVCHQVPERSFHIGEAQLPVCARCLGIYAGVSASTVFWVLGSRVPGSTVLGSRAVLIGSAVPTAATVAFVVVGAVAKLHYEPCAPQRPLAPRRPPTLI